MVNNEEIIKIIKNYTNVETVQLTDDLFTDLGYSSVKFIQLITKLENVFHFEFAEQYLTVKSLVTVQKLCETVNQMLLGGKDE